MTPTATPTMLEHLGAPGPRAEERDELMQFGRLAGSWDIDLKSIDGDGHVHDFTAEWHFGWTLGGRAVQDVLITRSPTGALVGYGTTVRTFDAKRRQWWIVWQDPVADEFCVLFGRPQPDKIVLDGQWTLGGLKDGQGFRWTFSDITKNSFRWEGHLREADGSWRLLEEMFGRRRA